jgi:hypothetical protein
MIDYKPEDEKRDTCTRVRRKDDEDWANAGNKKRKLIINN